MKNKSQYVAQDTQIDCPRSSFDLSRTHKTTLSCDRLVPFFVQEVVPADTHSVEVDLFLRMNTPLVPIMDDIKAETFFFFVPNRLTWDNFKKFMGEQDNPDDSINYLIPQMQLPTNGGFDFGWQDGSIGNYFGLPYLGTSGTGTYCTSYTVNALPFRAVHRIWNEWFRDQNLQDSSPFANTDDGPDIYDATETVAGEDFYTGNCLPRNKNHDYFTSCLPFPQKGPDVTIPVALSGTSSVVSTGNAIGYNASDGSSSGAALTWNSASGLTLSGSTPSSGTTLVYGTATGLEADFSSSTQTGTINDLREAFQLQKYFEVMATGGTRYIEIVHSLFGVRSSDARMQRSEYLGGGYAYVNMTPVSNQTRETDEPLGDLGATATLAAGTHGFTKSFEEHGYILGFLNLHSPEYAYAEGLNKMWTRQTRLDFYNPIFSQLGEQPVLSREISVNETADIKHDDVFGYQEIFADYKYASNMITGAMKSTSQNSLDVWHLAKSYTVPPVLNGDFVKQSTPLDRAIAVPDGPTAYGNTQFVADIYIKHKAARPIPLNGSPVSLGRY